MYYTPLSERAKKMKNNKRHKKTRKRGVCVIIVAAIIGVLCIAGFARSKYLEERFAKNTIIEGADCSYLEVPQAAEKVAEALSSKSIILKFGEKEYQFYGKDFGLEFTSFEELEKILAEQKNAEIDETGSNYALESLTANEDMVRKCLSELDELKPENMVKPKDAFINVSDDGTLEIEGEVLGNEIDFDEAVVMCLENLSFGKTNIDFNLIANIPMVVSTDEMLNENVKAVNHILSTIINFELTDGTIITLDKQTMKDWVCVDEDGIYYVEGSNIRNFVEELNQKVQETKGSLVFTPSDYDGQVLIPVTTKTELSIDVEAEITQIRQELAEAGTHTRSPIYEKDIDVDNYPSYVEIDITRQKVWMYYEGECIVDGVDCVTGNAGNHDTPTGLYYLKSKSRNAVLRGRNDDGSRYASPVAFWMPFNGGIGMHDASWRHGVFGGEIYKGNGSHGCVNMNYEDAKTIYEHIEKGMPIIVYASDKDT